MLKKTPSSCILPGCGILLVGWHRSHYFFSHQEQITKRSAVLDRDAVYTKKSKISRLPAYLAVEMVR